jgi:hypothetical protein
MSTDTIDEQLADYFAGWFVFGQRDILYHAMGFTVAPDTYGVF